VVHGVVAPEPADAVHGPVHPVIEELQRDEHQQDGRPAVEGDACQAMRVGEIDQGRRDAQRQRDLDCRAPEEVADRYGEGFPVIGFAAQQQAFEQGTEQYGGQGNEEQKLFNRLEHGVGVGIAIWLEAEPYPIEYKT